MNTQTHFRCQLTIIAEFMLETELAVLVGQQGAHGYTVHEVRGGSFSEQGARQREGAGDTDRTIEMKIVCERAVAEAIAAKVLADLAPNFSVRLLLSEVEVFRPAKY